MLYGCHGNTSGLIGGAEFFWMEIYQKEKSYSRNSEPLAILKKFYSLDRGHNVPPGLDKVQMYSRTSLSGHLSRPDTSMLRTDFSSPAENGVKLYVNTFYTADTSPFRTTYTKSRTKYMHDLWKANAMQEMVQLFRCGHEMRTCTTCLHKHEMSYLHANMTRVNMYMYMCRVK